MTITAELVGFIIMVFGAVSGVWWRIESKVKVAEDKADRVAADLAAQKLHTAEHYVSKQGLRETHEQLMAAIGGVKDAVDQMTLRVDRIVENQPKARTRSPS